MKWLKNDLVRAVAERSGYTDAVAREVLDAMCDVVKEAIGRGDEVMLAGLGKIARRGRSARMARNLHTGEAVPVRAHNAVTLSPSRSLQRAANP